MIEGYYYLHTNGKLIYKNSPDSIIGIRESDFCTTAWPMDTSNRMSAWDLLVEALSLGVDKKRISELANTWNCDDKDAVNYAEKVGVNLGVDGDQMTATRTDFENLQEHPAGFGDTYLEAMADLCKQLGNVSGKMWKQTFKDLCGA